MPTCAHCGEQWNYGETFKAQWRMKPKCPYCVHKKLSRCQRTEKKWVFYSTYIDYCWFTIGFLREDHSNRHYSVYKYTFIYPFTIEISKAEGPLW